MRSAPMEMKRSLFAQPFRQLIDLKGGLATLVLVATQATSAAGGVSFAMPREGRKTSCSRAMPACSSTIKETGPLQRLASAQGEESHPVGRAVLGEGDHLGGSEAGLPSHEEPL